MRANILGLEGKGAVVIGGASGIGRATSLLLGDSGCRVVVADLDAKAAEAVCGELRQRSGAEAVAVAVAGDVLTEQGAAEVVDRAADALGDRLDVLVNIVGFAAFENLLQMSQDTWDFEMLRNLTHHWWVCRRAAHHMIEQGTGGAMAFVGSVSGIYGAPSHGAYGAAKAGAMALGRTMAQEWGRHGIRVNTVAPDMIATPRVKASWEALGQDPDEIARAEGHTLGRFGRPEEIAGALVFLVSDLSGFITGQTIVVDGGVQAAFPHRGPAEFKKGG